MRKEILIRVQPDYDNGHHSKALKVAASIKGIESVTVTGRDRDLLLVIGDGVDEAKLVRKLNKELGGAEIVELQTLPPVASMDMVAALSPYHHHSTPGRSLPLPFSSQQAGYSYHPGHYHYPSPVGGPGGQVHRGGYGYGYGGSSSSSNTRAVARSHPANYSPMIARHDAHRVGWGRRRGGKPNCCTIL